MKSLTLALSILTGLSLNACTTTKDASNDHEMTSVKNDLGKGDAIIFQVAMPKPVSAPNDRAYYVSVRKSLKSSDKKLNATMATGEFHVAEEESRNELLKNPKSSAALKTLVIALVMQQKYRLAFYHADRFQKAFGDDATVLNAKAIATLGLSKSRVPDLEKSLQAFDRAFSADSKEIAAGLNLGHLSLEMGDARKALETFTSVRSRCGDCIDAVLGSGIAQSRLKNITAARSDFESVLKRDEHNTHALYRLALLHQLQGGNMELSKRYLDQILVYAPENDSVVRQKAEALLRSFEVEKPKSSANILPVADEN